MKKETWQQWARAAGRAAGSPSLFGPRSLAALTGQDTRALNAIAACWELYASSDEDGQRGALEAIRALLPAMQESTRWMARELIPFALDWPDRERLWPLVSGPLLRGVQ
jgi:hypothetical protein